MSTQLTTTEQQITTLFEQGFALSQKMQTAPGPLRAMYMALGASQLRDMLIQRRTIEALRPLINTKMGFRCDKKDYSDGQIADFIVDCLLHGDQLCGNHVNLIAGSRYVTKEGWLYKLEQAGAKQVKIISYLPAEIDERPANNTVWVNARMSVSASCTVNGVPFALEFRDDGPGRDSRFDLQGAGKDIQAAVMQLRGKAEARATAKLYQLVTGIADDDDQLEILPPDGVQSTDEYWESPPSKEIAAVIIAERNEHEARVAQAEQAQPQPAADPDYMQGLTEQERDIVAEWIAEFANANSMKQLQLAWTAFAAMAKKEQLRDAVMSVMTTAKDERKAALGG